MDVRISEGDVYLDAAGVTEPLFAVREAAQRVCIAATTTRGSFIYNRALGTDYNALDNADRLIDKLDMLIREATAGAADTEVTVTDADAEEKTAVLRIRHGGETIVTQVDLHGNI